MSDRATFLLRRQYVGNSLVMNSIFNDTLRTALSDHSSEMPWGYLLGIEVVQFGEGETLSLWEEEIRCTMSVIVSQRHARRDHTKDESTQTQASEDETHHPAQISCVRI